MTLILGPALLKMGTRANAFGTARLFFLPCKCKGINKLSITFKIHLMQKFSYHELLNVTILSLCFASYCMVTLLTWCLLVQTV